MRAFRNGNEDYLTWGHKNLLNLIYLIYLQHYHFTIMPQKHLNRLSMVQKLNSSLFIKAHEDLLRRLQTSHTEHSWSAHYSAPTRYNQ